MPFSSTWLVGRSCRKGRCMITCSGTRASPPASMPGGLSRYATESSASINRFSTCRTSSPHRTTRHRALARTISACAAQLRTAAAERDEQCPIAGTMDQISDWPRVEPYRVGIVNRLAERCEQAHQRNDTEHRYAVAGIAPNFERVSQRISPDELVTAWTINASTITQDILDPPIGNEPHYCDQGIYGDRPPRADKCQHDTCDVEHRRY